jgi:hypothetical protein
VRQPSRLGQGGGTPSRLGRARAEPPSLLQVAPKHTQLHPPTHPLHPTVYCPAAPAQVAGGMNVAVYADEDEQHQRYFLLRVLGPVLTLQRDQSDDFGQQHKRGDRVLVGECWLVRPAAGARPGGEVGGPLICAAICPGSCCFKWNGPTWPGGPPRPRRPRAPGVADLIGMGQPGRAPPPPTHTLPAQRNLLPLPTSPALPLPPTHPAHPCPCPCRPLLRLLAGPGRPLGPPLPALLPAGRQEGICARIKPAARRLPAARTPQGATPLATAGPANPCHAAPCVPASQCCSCTVHDTETLTLPPPPCPPCPTTRSRS